MTGAMDFADAARLGSLLARDHAEPMFELLVKYRDISASEAASRLGLHIRTAQDFLEGLAGLGILGREEVSEGKRPYYRYTLETEMVEMRLDLAGMAADAADGLSRPLRERKSAGARFTTARDGRSISAVTAWSGTGRDRKEHRIKLTAAQGRFLFHLPFPDAEPLTVGKIMERAGVEPDLAPEILDLVEVLDRHGVLDAAASSTGGGSDPHGPDGSR